MGQNLSMEENSLKTHLAEEKAVSSVKKEVINCEKDESSHDSSTDSDMKTNSVRAAIDSLIESCLGGKDADLDDPVKECDHVGKVILSKSPKRECAKGAPDSVDLFSNFMKDRIADMIRQDDSVGEATTSENTKPVKEANASVNVNKEKRLSVYESLRREEKMPQNTVRLQTLIDKVLDNSLGEDMQKSIPDIASCHVSNRSLAENAPRSLPTSTVSNSTSSDSTPKISGSNGTSTKGSPEMKCLQNRVECLMDHIERVLEKSFENGDCSSTPDISTKEVQQSVLSAPKPASGGSITQGKPVTSAASIASTDGTISVQDIVDRVISQTEVISKLLSPNSKENGEGSQEESKSTNNDVQKSHVVDHSRDPERSHHPRSMTTSASKTSHTAEQAALDIHNTRVDHRQQQQQQHQHVHKHPQEGTPYQQKPSSVDSVREPKHYEYSARSYSEMVKQNEAMMAQRYGPRAVAPYLNGAMAHAAMLPNAQMYMLRGHPMYMPQRPFPPPLVRADGVLAPESEPSSFPHLPSKTCRCSHCVAYFQFEDKSSRHAKGSTASSTVMMPTSVAQAETALYQNHLQVPIHAPHGQGLIAQQDLTRLQATSPSKFSNPMNLANMIQYQAAAAAAAAAAHPLKPMPIPVQAALSPGMSHMGEHFNQELAKSERKQERNVPHHRPDLYRPGDMVTKSGYHRKEEVPQRSAEGPIAAGRSVHHNSGIRADAAHPSKSVPQTRDERYPPHVPVLDLTVKIPDAPIAQPGPTSADSDQPLDLSKKPSPIVSMSRYYTRKDGGGSVHMNQTDSFSHENHHLQHLESSIDKLCHQAQGSPHGSYGNYGRKEVHPTDRGLGDAVMAPAVVSNMMMSPGGHRPQLHPIPAPTFSTTPNMPALSPVRPTYQGSISQGSPYPNIPQENMSPKTTSMTSSLSQAAVQQLRESPQPLASPQGSDKMDSSQRKGSISRHEPIQSIIGNHPPNDILYLICRLCRQTYGSPYGFRKHFRNQHGFEPRAEHTIVQTISATKSAMQGPYVINAPDHHHNEAMIPTGRSSAPLERETVPTPGAEYFKCKKESLSPGNPQGVSPSAQAHIEWGSGKPRVYRRVSDGRPRSALREDSDDVKFLECQECKQTFQLNDFGSYKRHCRQHHQARAPVPFVGPELKPVCDPNDKLVNKAATCRFCGGQFPGVILDEHIKSVHYKELCSEDQHHQHGKALSSHSSTPSPSPSEIHIQKSRMESCYPTELQKYLLEPVPNPNLEIQRLPADQNTVSASPDSSSDKPEQLNYPQPSSSTQSRTSSCVLDTNTDSRLAQCKSSTDKITESNSTVESRSKDLTYLHVTVVEDDKDSGFSGDRCSSSESRSLSIESAQDGASQASPAESDDPHSSFYRHKKFGGHRKRKESSETQETDAKVSKLDQTVGANVKGKSSSSSSSSSSNSQTSSKISAKSDYITDGDSSARSGEKELQNSGSPKKPENRTKQEARHQLPFVWDRVTRIQAGKNIKPPDYMT